MVKPKVYLLYGMTGSGKTARALDFAREEAKAGRVVEIINADSRQVYKGLPVLAACPTAAEYAEVRHHLFEFLELEQRYSAGQYAKDAQRVVSEVTQRGHVPVLVGGTGFYMGALEAKVDAPRVDVDEVVDKFGDMSVDELGAKVREVDPDWWTAANASERRNPQRMMRVLGVADATGKPLSAWQAEGNRAGGLADDYEVVRWVQEMDMDSLKVRLRARVAAGAEAIVAEVKDVLARGVAADAPGLQALGFDLWADVVCGRRTMASAMEETVKLHVAYAKRQRTWGKKMVGSDEVTKMISD